jgi:D-glycero-alpha-D-manno-heptose 1-phosphate guanylyltransferase
LAGRFGDVELFMTCDLERIPALILAGGFGMRLQSVIADRPKTLALVGARPFLHRLLEQLDQAGVRDVVLCTGHLGEQVERMLGATYGRMNLQYSREAGPLGTAGALRLGVERTQASANTVLALNGDSYCAVDLGAFARWHRSKRGGASVVLTETANTARFGRVTCAADDRIIAFSEKSATAAGAGWINAGIYLLERRRLFALPLSTELSLERTVFPQWLADGVYGFRGPRRFLDIGTPESYAAAPAFFALDEAAIL